jgi:hypothetical protein
LGEIFSQTHLVTLPTTKRVFLMPRWLPPPPLLLLMEPIF